MSEHTAPEIAGRSLKRGLVMGVASGLVAITCCVSPVVLMLLGIVTAAEAVTLATPSTTTTADTSVRRA